MIAIRVLLLVYITIGVVVYANGDIFRESNLAKAVFWPIYLLMKLFVSIEEWILELINKDKKKKN